MNNSNQFCSIPQQVRTLIHRSFDEPLNEGEVTQLQRALRSNPAARRLYSELAQLNADLVSQKQANALCNEVQHEFRDVPEVGGVRTEAPVTFTQPWHRIVDTVRMIPLRMAACLLVVGLGLGCAVGIFAATLVHVHPQFLPMPWNWRVGNDVVARIESTHDVTWQASESPETPPTRGLRAGQQLRIERGLLQITYRNGVEVILQGPAVYEIRSEQGGKLFSGRLSAKAPSNTSTFHIDTPVGTLQIGPGRFGVDVENSTSDRRASIYGFSGIAPGVTSAQFVGNSGRSVELVAGNAIQFDVDGLASDVTLPPIDEFPDRMPSVHKEPYTGDTIYLGNVFDDGKTASLEEAVATDLYQAAAETIDLGVAAVHDGGLDVDVSLAEEGVLFNFSNVGGGGAKVLGLPSNDTYRSVLGIPIRTTGSDLPFRTNVGHSTVEGSATKIEEGIGISSNELLTFDLNELREAGKLVGRAMRFVSDRAGINDRELPVEASRSNAHANLIVVVSTEDRVLSAYLNGQAADVVKHATVYSLNVDEARASRGLRYDGRFVSFDVPIPTNARFLTLVSTQLESEHHDHTVFSGARLELAPQSRDDLVGPK